MGVKQRKHLKSYSLISNSLFFPFKLLSTQQNKTKIRASVSYSLELIFACKISKYSLNQAMTYGNIIKKHFKSFALVWITWIFHSVLFSKLINSLNSLWVDLRISQKVRRVWESFTTHKRGSRLQFFETNVLKNFAESLFSGVKKVTPCPKLVRIMLETWNLVHKYTQKCTFGKYTF